MTFETFIEQFLDWSETTIEQKKEDGFSVCPYAKKARISNKIQFIDARDTTIDKLRTFNKEVYDIGIVWLGDNYDMTVAEDIADIMRNDNRDLLYFTSTPTSGYFAKNFTKCIFIQITSDIEEKRKHLHTTDYYDSWSDDYYKIITGR